MKSSTKTPSQDALTTQRDEFARFVEYWRILVRRRRVVLAITGLTLLITIVLTWLATPTYRATATLQIERRGPEILTYQDVVSVDPSWTGLQNFYETQYRILQSRAVLRLAARKLDLTARHDFAGRRPSPAQRLRRWIASLLPRKENPDDAGRDPLTPAVGFLAAGLSVQPVRYSHLVEISFTDREPTLARDAANAVVAAYQEFTLHSRYSTTEQATDFLAKQVAQLKREITEKERQLQEYTEKREILDTGDDNGDIHEQALGELNGLYVQAKGRLAMAEARLRSVRQAEPAALPEVVANPLVKSLKQRIVEMDQQYAEMSGRFGPEWPALENLEQELDATRQRLVEETNHVAEQVRKTALAERDRASAEVEALQARLEEQKTQVRRARRDAVGYAGLKAEIETKQRFLDQLVGRQNQTAVADRLQDTQASNVRVVDAAEIPRSPVRPRKFLNLLVGLLMGLSLGVAAAMFLDHMDNTVKTEQDVTRVTGLPVLGRVPIYRPLRVVAEGAEDPGPDPVATGILADPKSSFAESFKYLRTSLLLACPDHPPRHIVITSGEPGDGKSTVSVNLGLALAQMGRRVLVVDADLRRPRLHKLLEAPATRGLSTFLTGGAELDELILDSVVPGLKLLPAGPIPPSPSELLGSPRMTTLLQLSEEGGGFDQIILDSPPVIQVPDAVILSSAADVSVLVVRSEKTVRQSLAEGADRLRQATGRVLGAVLNAATPRSDYYYYYYYRGGTERRTRDENRRTGRFGLRARSKSRVHRRSGNA